MRLTKVQENILANRFWQRGENYLQAILRKGFSRLTYAKFYKVINAKKPNKIVWKGKKWNGYEQVNQYKHELEQGFNTCFMSMAEYDQLRFRDGLPIPEETKKLFRIGRLAAYYNNPI